MEVTQFDDPEWPFSDTAWVITSAPAETVLAWFAAEVVPDECWTGWPEDRTYEPIEVPSGMSPIACWWD